MDPLPVEEPGAALRHAGIDATALPTDGVLIAEIAGRDSVAATVEVARARRSTLVLPTAAHTGTEYGDFHAPHHAAARLREILLPTGTTVLPLVHLASPALWAALNGRYASVIAERFGIFSPCLACHLYMHLCRVPLAWSLGDAAVVAGERDTHDGKVKLSQLPLGIDAATRVLARARIQLLEPLRFKWSAGGEQLCCVHSGNYRGLDGAVAYDELAYARYVHGFLEPAGRAVVDAWRTDAAPDYADLVAGVLEGPEAA
jgi:hypothetical protein